MGLSTSDINAQLAYIRKEAEGSYKSAWKDFLNATTIDEATNVFRSEFEQTPSGVQARLEAAQKTYNALC